MNNRIKLYLAEICLGTWMHRQDTMDGLPHVSLEKWREIIVREVWSQQKTS